jgi:hypothetical protein
MGHLIHSFVTQRHQSLQHSDLHDALCFVHIFMEG